MRLVRDISDVQLRAARVRAARTRDFRSILRRGVLAGEWDRGAIVRAMIGERKRYHQPKEKEHERI